METFKFLMVSTHFPPYKMGGDAIFVGYLANELARRGHEVHVAYDPSVFRILRGDVPQSQQEDRMERIMRHEYSPAARRLELSLCLTLGMSARAKTWLESTAKRLSSDVIHWHNTKGFIGRPFAISGTQQLYTAHDYYSVCPRSNLIRPGDRTCLDPYLCQMCLIRWRRPPQIWRARGRRVLEFPEGFKVLCPSEFMAERLRRDGIRVHRVLRGFVPDPGPGAGATSPRSETIVFVGILERRKGSHTLLQAFINSKVDQGFNLAIVGEGPLKGELRARVQSEGVQNRVSVPGFLAGQDLRALMSQAALMVVPSEWPENAPSTALEAFSYGVPVLGTREGGLPEILSPESGSMLFDSGDVDELSGLLVSLWNDRKALLAKGGMARRVYEERFNPAAHVTEYLSVLKD